MGCEVQVVKLQVTGMTCSSCSSAVEKSLLMLEGVQHASVALSLQQAEVHVAAGGVDQVRILLRHCSFQILST